MFAPLVHLYDGLVSLFGFEAVPAEDKQHLLPGEERILRQLQLFLGEVLVELGELSEFVLVVFNLPVEVVAHPTLFELALLLLS